MQEEQSLELKREKARLKARCYRAKNKERVRAYDRARWHERKGEQSRLKIFEGRKCKLCGIPLTVRYHGGHGTRVYCVTCSENKRLQGRLNTRRFRERQKSVV